MKLINQHIRQHFNKFNVGDTVQFNEIYNLIQSDFKDNYRELLKHLDHLLNVNSKNKESQILHIHFSVDLGEECLSLLAQYLLIRMSNEGMSSASKLDFENEVLESIKNSLKSNQRRLTACPDGASGRNGGNKIYKSWIREKQIIRSNINFYNQFDDKQNFNFINLFNCQVRLYNSLNSFLELYPYARDAEDYSEYPVLNVLNTKATLSELDEIDNSIIDNLKSVILFDCDRKRHMQYFSIDDIKDYDIELKNYLMFSFGNKNNSVQSLKEKIQRIQNRFKIGGEHSYVVTNDEEAIVLNQFERNNIEVEFVGNEFSEFWDAFILETSMQDLYELRSIRMMNLYSLCYSEEIKEFIIGEIFSKDIKNSIISVETKQKLSDLREDDVLEIRSLLSNILDLIINLKIDLVITNQSLDKHVLVIDNYILKFQELIVLLQKHLQNLGRIKFVSWADIEDYENDDLLILSYQDQGRFPYFFSPNIIELEIKEGLKTAAILPGFLFEEKYKWAHYRLLKEFHSTLNHPIRKDFFDWENLRLEIQKLKPTREDSFNWDLEQEYFEYSHRETVKLKLINERERTYNLSELFIYSHEVGQYRVARISDILEFHDAHDKLQLHHLDEIQEDINLYDGMVDLSQQQEELKIIKKEFNLDSSDSGRLWKLLLKKKSELISEEGLYSDLEQYLNERKIKIVSFLHFKNTWINPDSESIAPLSKKTFIELCNYLNLPKTYYVIIQRLRNATKQSSRQSTRKMNNLLQDLFNNGSFDNDNNLQEIVNIHLEEYKRLHSLEDLGIDEKYASENLTVLVELIKSELELKEMEYIKKAE